MFTGIIQTVGAVKQLQKTGGDVRLHISCDEFDFEQIALGDSIAVNGVCLTVVTKSDAGFAADVSIETLEHTSLRQLAAGVPVNLECAVTPATPLGGPFSQRTCRRRGRNYRAARRRTQHALRRAGAGRAGEVYCEKRFGLH